VAKHEHLVLAVLHLEARLGILQDPLQLGDIRRRELEIVAADGMLQTIESRSLLKPPQCLRPAN
jgi:hypothetical protein